MKNVTEQPSLAVAVNEPMPLAIQPQGITIEQAFNAAATKALDKDSLAVMKELLAMDSERKFNIAFVAMQKEMPTIVATSMIPNRGRYEKFEDIWSRVAPVMTKFGFSASFSQDILNDRIVETCHLMHDAGHTRKNSFAVRSGGRADSDTQADCKASTTAKRNAFCNALNIVIRQDCLDEEHDAKIEGDPNAKVTKEQADELARRVGDLGDEVKMPAFWQYARATKYSDIPASMYDSLDKMLAKKEGNGR
jgi:hypothetical protein